MYEKIVKYLPLLTIIVFLISYGYQNSYYAEFNINILMYESNSEILYTLLPLSIIFFGTWTTFIQRGNESQKMTQNAIANKKKKVSPFLIFIIIYACLIVLQIILKRIFGIYRDQPLVLMTISVCSIILIGYEQLILIWKSRVITNNNLIAFTLIFGTLAIQYAQNSAYVIKNLGSEKTYIFYYKDKVVVTDNHFFLVGETQSSLFVYNSNDKFTTILKRSDIDSIKIRKND